MILDLASSKAVAETDWYQHDYRPYLWPLSPGHLLLRKSNSLYVLDSDLHETLLKDFPGDVLWANITSDGKQIIAETASEGSGGTEGEATNRKQQTEDSRRARVKIEFLNSNSLAVERPIQATGVLELDALSSGYADFTHNLRDNIWLVRFGPSSTERQRVARVKSPCEPNLPFPTNNAVLIGRCSSNGRDYNVSVFSLTGHPLWRQRWPQLNYFPGLARSEDGSRFAVGTITASREMSPPRTEVSPPLENDEDDPRWPDVEQDVRVFETASGKLILAARVKSVVLKNPNFALAPNGSRFALLNGSILRIYDLPPASADERAKYLALAADAPGLISPTGNSSEVSSCPLSLSVVSENRVARWAMPERLSPVIWDGNSRETGGASRPGCSSIETDPTRTTTGTTEDRLKNPTTHPNLYVPLPGVWLPGSRGRWWSVLQTVAICCNLLQAPAGNPEVLQTVSERCSRLQPVTKHRWGDPSVETKRNCDPC